MLITAQNLTNVSAISKALYTYLKVKSASYDEANWQCWLYICIHRHLDSQ